MYYLEYFVDILWIVYFTMMIIIITAWMFALITSPQPELKYRYS